MTAIRPIYPLTNPMPKAQPDAPIQRAAFFPLVEMGELSDDAEGQAKLSLQSGDLLSQLGT